MILINLLPHREAARKKRRDSFYAYLGLSALVGGLIAGSVYTWYQAQIVSQEGRNNLLSAENTKLDEQIKNIAELQNEISALRARQQAVEDLQSDRNQPVYLLNELVKQIPDGIYVAGMKQEGQAITLQGVAQSNERVAELLRNLSKSSEWLQQPELIEITAADMKFGVKDLRRVSNFTIRAQVKRSSEEAAKAEAGKKA